jgi:hypothetical protein
VNFLCMTAPWSRKLRKLASLRFYNLLDIILIIPAYYVFVQDLVNISFLLVDGLNGLILLKLVFMVLKPAPGAAMNILLISLSHLLWEVQVELVVLLEELVLQ